MEIDNKTKAAVLREFADNMSEPGVDRSVYELARSEADKLDPPEKLIRPHDGCEGMIVECIKTGEKTVFREYYKEYPGIYSIPREASKVPAFLCDGTRPEWVKDGDFVWFYTCMSTAEAWVTDWQRFNGMHFCVINPIEVQ